MTDQTRSGESPVSLVYSPGDGVVVDAGNPDEKLIDMDESYKTVEKENIGSLVDGVEQYRQHRVLDIVNARFAGLSGIENYDPLASRRNGVLGGENFLVTIRDGFIKFIKLIIEYITKAYNWLADKVKGFFGWGKTQKQIVDLENKSKDLRQDLATAMLKIQAGGPNLFSVSDFFEGKPKGLDRLETIKFIKGKSDDLEETVVSLNEALDISRQLQKLLNRKAELMSRDKKKLAKHFDAMRNDLKHNRATITTMQAFQQACSEITLDTLSLEDVNGLTVKLYQLLYGVTLPSKSAEKLDTIKGQLISVRKALDYRIDPKSSAILHQRIGALITEISNNPVDFTPLSYTNDVLKVFVNMDDANTLNVYAAKVANNPSEETYYKNEYLNVSNRTKDFTALVDQIAVIFRDITLQLTTAIQWKQRVDALLNAYIANDVRMIANVYDALANEGVDLKSHKSVQLNIIPENQIGAEIGAVINELVKHNINGLGQVADNILRQVGLNPGVIKNG